MKTFESIFRGDFETWIDEKLIQRPNPVFFEMEDFALESKIPILSPMAGSVLKFLIEVFCPKKILELGTGLGYSTAWMFSTGLPLEILSLDRSPEALSGAEYFLNKLVGPNQTIQFLRTHCLHYIRDQHSFADYDFIFVDCDKVTYPEILENLLLKTKSGANLIFDNVLWHGRLDPKLYSRPSDIAIHKFWDQVNSLDNQRTLFPSGDGLLYIKV
jgi:caffeoyl-CoA O-methyltransferase